MSTLGDVRKYLKEDETHLLVSAVINPHHQRQYAIALADLIKQIAREHGLKSRMIKELAGHNELTPESEGLFDHLKRTVDNVVDAI